MTKAELLNSLENLKNNFFYGFVATQMLPDEAWEKIINGKKIACNQKAVTFGKYLVGLASHMIGEDKKSKKVIIDEFRRSLMRAMLREPHEIILKYCEETNQFNVYKDQPWFQFMRIIRNTCSHKEGGILREWPYDLQKRNITSVRWKKRKLDVSMVGKHIEFNIPDTFDAWHDIKLFAERKLK